MEIVVDTREQYAYRFATQQVVTVRRALPCGDYGVVVDGRLVAVAERKSLPDLVSSLINGKLRYLLGELAALPRAAIVVEDRYSQVFKLDRVRPAWSRTGWPSYRSAGPACRSSSAKPANSPRNGPTATSPPPTHGPHRTCPRRTHQRRLGQTGDRNGSPRAGGDNQRSPRMGTRQRNHRARSGPASPRHLASMARRPATVTTQAPSGGPGGLGLPGPAAHRTPGNQSLARLFIPLFP